jgi:hypothetical protein
VLAGSDGQSPEYVERVPPIGFSRTNNLPTLLLPVQWTEKVILREVAMKKASRNEQCLFASRRRPEIFDHRPIPLVPGKSSLAGKSLLAEKYLGAEVEVQAVGGVGNGKRRFTSPVFRAVVAVRQAAEQGYVQKARPGPAAMVR